MPEKSSPSTHYLNLGWFAHLDLGFPLVLGDGAGNADRLAEQALRHVVELVAILAPDQRRKDVVRMWRPKIDERRLAFPVARQLRIRSGAS